MINFKDIFGAYNNIEAPNNTWKRFAFNCLLIFLGWLLVLVFAGPSINKVLFVPVEYRPYIFFGSYSACIFIYFITFIVSRINIKVRFSKQVNIVLAYNADGVNQVKFGKKYKFLVKELENQIVNRNLGERINVVIVPADVKLKSETAAEAMTQLGLLGSTLLVWGYVTKDRNSNIHKFVTRFSYEFGYPSDQNKEQAKERFAEEVNLVFESGLLPDINVSDFPNQVLPISLYLLGITSYTLSLFDDSRIYFEKFIEVTSGLDILRKREMGFSIKKANTYLIIIYFKFIDKLFVDYDKNKETILRFALKINAIDERNYGALIHLAYYYEHIGDNLNADKYQKLAILNAKKGHHDHLFNEAYFSLKKGDFVSAFGIYKEIPEGTTSAVTFIVEDLHKWSLKNKNFIFGEGCVNFRWGDKKMGRQQIKRFINKLTKIAEYEDFVSNVKSYIN